MKEALLTIFGIILLLAFLKMVEYLFGPIVAVIVFVLLYIGSRKL